MQLIVVETHVNQTTTLPPMLEVRDLQNNEKTIIKKKLKTHTRIHNMNPRKRK
jgi:hypothetical protein